MQRYLLYQLRFGSEQFFVAFLGRECQQVDAVIVNQADLLFDEIEIELMKGFVGFNQFLKKYSF